MALRLVAVLVCALPLVMAGCAGSGAPREPASSPPPANAPPGPASSLDDGCITAVGADRNPCQAR